MFIVLCFVIGIAYIQYLKSALNDSDNEEITLISENILNAEKLPDRFSELYHKVYSSTNTNEEIFNQIIGKYDSECPCLSVARNSFMFHTDWFKNNYYVVSWKLEENLDKDDCLNYYASKFDFIDNNIGVENASNYYYNKPLNKLNDIELIGLIVMMKNPSLYNPKHKPDVFKERVLEALVFLQLEYNEPIKTK